MSDQREPRDSAASSDASAAADGSAAAEGSAASARPTGKRAARRPRDTGTTAGSSAGSAASTSGSTTAGKSVATASRVPGRQRAEATPKQNIFKRLRKFLREVVAELRKVIWPNRKQMVTYTAVVLVFVTFMVAYISGLDLAFIRGVQWLFG
ncbi:preprotein translocase subunit SecE [Rhodococcoides corynebacterioides]|uniref:Protein translocase subunit SecE n=1 Tax=Rhodococcoides corynebacterioides TaxID=53972 RepID=A0ABS7P5W2_9NOCA|nr:preprotein translocase subunit SecE [Rhodococcus corynebacterioides]MBY6367812.1 preprotein translocase subunit SecE [Rhodococcus corynebacterioides]MBY6408293.1 preprotein translocase subunit SecE [Rhodococcus corynebacterioides]